VKKANTGGVCKRNWGQKQRKGTSEREGAGKGKKRAKKTGRGGDKRRYSVGSHEGLSFISRRGNRKEEKGGESLGSSFVKVGVQRSLFEGGEKS